MVVSSRGLCSSRTLSATGTDNAMFSTVTGTASFKVFSTVS